MRNNKLKVYFEVGARGGRAGGSTSRTDRLCSSRALLAISLLAISASLAFLSAEKNNSI